VYRKKLDMAHHENIDQILRNWSFEPDTVKVRMVEGHDRRDVIQMRIDLGLLQLEVDGRPDGQRPFGHATYYDYLLSREKAENGLELTEDQCWEVDREFVQFYHRRICWLTLRQFDRAVADADHTLALMDLCIRNSPDEQWSSSHEQYRPFVLFHRIQAAALGRLEAEAPEAAIEEINRGLDQLREVFDDQDADGLFDEEEVAARLEDLRETLRDHYQVGLTLEERLQEAVAREEYELAAQLRDEMARRQDRWGR
jgi:hypothetical protein